MEKPRFAKNEQVVLRARPEELGIVLEEPLVDAGEYWYRVRFTKRVEMVVEEELDAVASDTERLENLLMAGTWGRVEAFNRALAIERLRDKNRSTVYSFNAQRILFQPHQYKPLLRFLDSLDRRLLIADEVGLGKTIEAGLILAELEARTRMDRVFVVCPARLRDKWREEMNRKFGQDFEIFDRRRLEATLARIEDAPHRAGFRGIVSMSTMRAEDLLRRFVLALDGVDLLIVDEAHHARNPETLTSRMVSELAESADAVLFLTATPLHLGSRDLFTLLRALRPDQFTNAEVFDADLRRNEGVVRAHAMVRARRADRLGAAADEIVRVFGDPFTGEIDDTLVVHVVERLRGNTPKTRAQWIELERLVESLHLLSDVVTRTRKKDVQTDVGVRKSHPVMVHWTDEEQRLYEAIAGIGAWPSGPMSFGQVQRERQAASCLPAAWAARRDRQHENDSWVEQIDIEPSLIKGLARNEEPADIVFDSVETVPDTKFAKLVEILDFIKEDDPGAKLLIFTFFVGTSRYLDRELRARGWPTLRIAGDVPSRPHDPERDERGKILAQFRDDPEARILVSTEVGSEGLDFQFCHHLVNYDLPWNPMVVEQRIGRIDRFGQKAEVLHVHSLVVSGTIEDRILSRLYQRIGIFERSIGALEPILGEAVHELQREIVTGGLSAQEASRRVEEIADALENKKKQMEILQEKAGDLFGHEDYIRDEVNRVRRLGRYITPRSILAIVEGYLHQHFPGVKIKREGEDLHSLAMPDDLLQDVQTRADVTAWDGLYRCRNAKNRLVFTTDGEAAFEHPNVDLFNATHPVVRAAVAATGEGMSHVGARTGQAVVHTSSDESGIPGGLVFVVVFAHTIKGIRSRRLFDAFAWSLVTGEVLREDYAEQLLYLVTEQGQSWDLEDGAPSMPTDAWQAVQSAARHSNRALKAREQSENDALYSRRKRGIEAEHDHRRRQIDKRLATARQAGRDRKVIHLFETQIAKTNSRRKQRLEELDSNRAVSVALSEPLAACVVDVRQEEPRQ